MGIIDVEPALVTSPLPPIRRACVNCSWFRLNTKESSCYYEPGSQYTKLTDFCSHFEPSQAVLDLRSKLVDEFEKTEVSL